MSADKQGPILTLAHSLKRFAPHPSKISAIQKNNPIIY